MLSVSKTVVLNRNCFYNTLFSHILILAWPLNILDIIQIIPFFPVDLLQRCIPLELEEESYALPLKSKYLSYSSGFRPKACLALKAVN